MSAPAFERRHYNAVAAILARAAARAQHNDTCTEVVSDLVQDFVDAFRADNADFKPARFVEAVRA